LEAFNVIEAESAAATQQQMRFLNSKQLPRSGPFVPLMTMVTSIIVE
jgi:hypothetical protein